VKTICKVKNKGAADHEQQDEGVMHNAVPTLRDRLVTTM
jgi:hypothetical protein